MHEVYENSLKFFQLYCVLENSQNTMLEKNEDCGGRERGEGVNTSRHELTSKTSPEKTLSFKFFGETSLY